MKKNILQIQINPVSCKPDLNFKGLEKIFAGFKSTERRADLIILPEFWSLGWTPEKFREFAEDENGKTINFLKDFALENNVSIIGGTMVRKVGNELRNSCPIISSSGNLLGFYDKIHLFAFDMEDKVLNAGDEPCIFNLDGLKVALSVCYDLRFPRLFEHYTEKADLIVNMAAWPKVRIKDYITLTTARALEGQAYFAGVNLCGTGDKVEYGGNSIFINPYGEVISSLKNAEGYILNSVDTEFVAHTREKVNHAISRKEIKKEVKILNSGVMKWKIYWEFFLQLFWC